MKRINEYKKLFNVDNDTTLRSLKSTYRNLVKEWHTDKFPEGHELYEEAELKSRQIIDAYHFLVGIAPETKAANQEEYENVTTQIGIADLKHKGLLLEVTFLDGSAYEYYGVNKAVFQKMINSDKQARFAKRSIYNSYTYRKSKKATVTAEAEVD
jgi:DnaJ-class molecular chaperone